MHANSGERYDPRTNTWTQIPSMPRSPWHLVTAIMDDKIFALDNIRRRKIQCFDKRTNEWFVCLFVTSAYQHEL
jgi:hypothetical protein